MIPLDGTQPNTAVEATATSHSGGSSSPVAGQGRLVLCTWLPMPLQVDAEPLLPAPWDDVEQLLQSQCERFEGAFRRLA